MHCLSSEFNSEPKVKNTFEHPTREGKRAGTPANGSQKEKKKETEKKKGSLCVASRQATSQGDSAGSCWWSGTWGRFLLRDCGFEWDNEGMQFVTGAFLCVSGMQEDASGCTGPDADAMGKPLEVSQTITQLIFSVEAHSLPK